MCTLPFCNQTFVPIQNPTNLHGDEGNCKDPLYSGSRTSNVQYKYRDGACTFLLTQTSLPCASKDMHDKAHKQLDLDASERNSTAKKPFSPATSLSAVIKVYKTSKKSFL